VTLATFLVKRRELCYPVAMPTEAERHHASWLGREALGHADTLFNLARYLTASDTDGEDLVQETFVRAIASSHQFQGGNLKAWLFKILRNAFIDLYRRNQHNPVKGGLDTVRPSVEAPRDEELLRDDLEVHQLRNVVAADIASALARLSDEARTVILLDLEGLTETEVADVLGCAVGTVKSRIHRARATLRQELKGYAR